MNVTIYASDTKREQRLVSAIADGFKQHGVGIEVITKTTDIAIPPGTDLVTFIGVKSRKIRDACVKVGVPYLLIDKGYFQRGRYHRFSLNGFIPCYLGSGLADYSRFKSLQLRIINRRRLSANKIVFIGFDAKYAAYHGIGSPEDYAAGVYRKVKEVIARKRSTSLMLHIRNRAERNTMPLSVLLPSCHCVITHGSVAGVESLMAGVPVIALGQREASVVYDLASSSLDDVIRPKLPEDGALRKRLAELAWCQFTTAELQDGLPWEVIGQQYKRL